MDGRKEKISWIQCQCCGHVYTIQKEISIDISIIESKCPKCWYKIGLNCGDKKEDLYLFMNENIDPRYYSY